MTAYSLSPVLFESVSNVTATMGLNDAEVGTVMRIGDEVYRKVYNTGASAASVGCAVTVSGVTGYSVTVSLVSNDIAVGVVKHAVLSASCYGWVMTEGYSSIELQADTSGVTGAIFQPGTDGLWVTKVPSTSTSAHLWSSAHGAKIMESIASGASGQAYIKL